MSFKRVAARSLKFVRLGLASAAMFQFALGGPMAAGSPPSGNQQADRSLDEETRTPIKHVFIYHWRKPVVRSCVRYL